MRAGRAAAQVAATGQSLPAGRVRGYRRSLTARTTARARCRWPTSAAPSACAPMWQANQKRAAARNAGLTAAAGEVVLFLDDDMQAAPGLLRAHLARTPAGTGAGVVGPVPSDCRPARRGSPAYMSLRYERSERLFAQPGYDHPAGRVLRRQLFGAAPVLEAGRPSTPAPSPSTAQRTPTWPIGWPAWRAAGVLPGGLRLSALPERPGRHAARRPGRGTGRRGAGEQAPVLWPSHSAGPVWTGAGPGLRAGPSWATAAGSCARPSLAPGPLAELARAWPALD